MQRHVLTIRDSVLHIFHGLVFLPSRKATKDKSRLSWMSHALVSLKWSPISNIAALSQFNFILFIILDSRDLVFFGIQDYSITSIWRVSLNI